MRIRISTLLILASLVGGAAATAFAQSLADVARQEEARRKAIRAPVKVITNTDLKPVLPPETETPAPAATGDTPADAATPADGAKSGDAAKPADGAKPADAAKPAEPVKDQAYWSGRLKGLQDQLERDQSFAAALQVQISAQTADFTARDDPAQRAVIDQNRNKSLADLSRTQKAIVDDQKAIADLQEEARQAGVPPGWLR
jgi:hypothetical protein